MIQSVAVWKADSIANTHRSHYLLNLVNYSAFWTDLLLCLLDAVVEFVICAFLEAALFSHEIRDPNKSQHGPYGGL